MVIERIVYIVDDDAGVCRSLERLLDAYEIRSECFGTPLAFLEAAPSLVAGCGLLDLRMPGMNGIELQAELLRIRPDFPVVIMTGQGDVKSAVRAMKTGAVDFIEKPYSDETLLNAVESALGFSESSRSEEQERAATLVGSLSRREHQVLDALVAGQPNKVIAYELGLSVRTVEVHRSRMMDRLGVRQLAEAVRLAVLARLNEEG